LVIAGVKHSLPFQSKWEEAEINTFAHVLENSQTTLFDHINGASHQKKRQLVMGDAAEGRRGAAYVFRNTDWLLNLRVNEHPSRQNTLILCAKYHQGKYQPTFRSLIDRICENW